jgi:hypothetical protein
MSVTDTMRWMGRSALHKTEALGHSMKDRALEKRFERASEEAARLRFENDLLRDEVAETRSEHGRILGMLETRLSAQPEIEIETGRPHRGRWLLLLMALAGGAYAWTRMRSNGRVEDEWSGMQDSPAVTQMGTASL